MLFQSLYLSLLLLGTGILPFQLPQSVLAGAPGPLKSLSGRDYSHHLRRTDEPFPIRLRSADNHVAAVPRTLQVPSERRSLPRMGGVLLASRDPGCDSGYTACSDGSGCCVNGSSCCTDIAMCTSTLHLRYACSMLNPYRSCRL